MRIYAVRVAAWDALVQHYVGKLTISPISANLALSSFACWYHSWSSTNYPYLPEHELISLGASAVQITFLPTTTVNNHDQSFRPYLTASCDGVGDMIRSFKSTVHRGKLPCMRTSTEWILFCLTLPQ